MERDERLRAGLDELGLPYTEEQLDQLHRYYDMLIETNRVMNLTAITEYDDVCMKHWLDSLCLVKILSEEEKASPLRLVDVGTGAGFPGIPLKIFFPHWSITLMDALGKRVRFLEQVASELNLDNTECIHGRAEELARKEEYREQYDLCVSRAVTRMASLTELCVPLVKVGGSFVAYKAADCGEEVAEAGNAIVRLGGRIVSKETFTVPQSDLGRTMIRVKKAASTDRKYPRGGGKPMKDPIR